MEMASTCEPGSIGAVIVLVALLVVADICDDKSWCQTGVNSQEATAPHSQSQTRVTTKRPISPFKRRCNRSTQRDEFKSRGGSPKQASRSLQAPLLQHEEVPESLDLEHLNLTLYSLLNLFCSKVFHLYTQPKTARREAAEAGNDRKGNSPKVDYD